MHCICDIIIYDGHLSCFLFLLQELRGKNEVLLEAKAKLEDEVDSFQSKASMLGR